MISADVELLRSSDIDGGFLYPELRLRLARGYYLLIAFGDLLSNQFLKERLYLFVL